MKRLISHVFALLLTVWPLAVLAGEGESAVTMGLSYENLLRGGETSKPGFGVTAGYRYGLKDDWNLFGQAGYQSYFGSGERLDQMSVVCGAGYVVDATTWVPEIYGGVGYFGPTSVNALESNVGLVLGIGMEYRRVRDFGVGIRFEYRVFMLNREVSPQASALSLVLARYF